MEMNRLSVLDTNPLRPRIENGRIIKIINRQLSIFDFYFSLVTEPEASRSETLVVAGLRLHGCSYPTAGDNDCMPVMARTLNPAVGLSNLAETRS